MPAETKTDHKRVLVLGAYGLIGSFVFRALEKHGMHVVGLGRNAITANKVLPNREWMIFDIAKLLDAKDWSSIVSDFDVVVNCAGALQEGPGAKLEELHFLAIKALAQACRDHEVRLVQISAMGADLNAESPFLSTKARGDSEIRSIVPQYAIFKPGMVFAPTGFGGSSLVRALAAFPVFQPLTMGRSYISTIGIDDLTKQVCKACFERKPVTLEMTLAAQTPISLKEVVLTTREWLGFGRPKFLVELPKWTLTIVSKFADFLGHLGWRSPLRSNSISVLSNDVIAVQREHHLKTSSLHQTFMSMPATSEDRIAARMALLFPFTIALLSLFWLFSGLIGIFQINAAASVLTDEGWNRSLATLSVFFWSIVDIGLGVFVLIRRFAKRACIGMIAVSIVYLVSSTLFVPYLWLDPLGPLLKVFPSIFLALYTIPQLEDR